MFFSKTVFHISWRHQPVHPKSTNMRKRIDKKKKYFFTILSCLAMKVSERSSAIGWAPGSLAVWALFDPLPASHIFRTSFAILNDN